MIGVLIGWALSAVVLFLLQFVPFLDIYFGANIVSFIIVAVVIGLINGLLVPLVKNILKIKNPLVLLVATLLVDACALVLAGFLPIAFGIGFVSAIIAAAVLSVLNLGAGMVNR
ncbi:MAG: phage holin family protein [Defluviitaleaceae bacterium]|nr:phage holin family protein [Defluviitaleaceae bacterium]